MPKILGIEIGASRIRICEEDYKTLLEIYFCGKYDKAYEKQLKACGEELPDYSFYLQKRR